VVPVNETEVLQAPAWAASAAGDRSAGRRQLEAAADLGEEIGDLIGAVGALYGLARLGHARRVSARLTALAAQVDGDLAAARASALTARDSEALAKVAGQFEELGAILCAAEASAEAAVLLRHAGEARQAAAAEQRAARLLARCEGAATPPPVRLITARVRLTQGELDTAMQAAAGRSNKQIAADMQLSVRTVKATCSGATRSSASPAPTSWPARCGTSPPPDPPGRSVVPPRNPVAATDARPPPPWPTGAVHAA
jgi:DNA-binding NarL/FixJ family response regulator